MFERAEKQTAKVGKIRGEAEYSDIFTRQLEGQQNAEKKRGE